MSTVKRGRWVVPFLIAAALLAGTSAYAGNAWTPLRSTGVVSTASGDYQLHWTGKWFNESLDVTVRCAGLEAGTYYVTVWLVDFYDPWNSGPFVAATGAFTADARGNGGAAVKNLRTYTYAWHHVDVSDASGAVILTTSQY